MDDRCISNKHSRLLKSLLLYVGKISSTSYRFYNSSLHDIYNLCFLSYIHDWQYGRTCEKHIIVKASKCFVYFPWTQR